MEAARDAAFHQRRWHHRRRCRFTVHAEVESATTAIESVAGQGDERFLVAEQLTQKMSHPCLPNEAFHCRDQLGSGERPSRRQQSWFCDGDPSQTRRRDTCAASHPSAGASTVANDRGVMLDATTSSRLSSSDDASRSTRAVSRISSYPGYRRPHRRRAQQRSSSGCGRARPPGSPADAAVPDVILHRRRSAERAWPPPRLPGPPRSR
jgi:hypothetical protein